MATHLFDEYLKQMKDLQKKVFSATIENLPGGGNQNDLSAPLKKALSFQKGLLNVTLKAQETGINMALSAQQEMWRSYFKLLRNNPHMK